MLADIPAFVSSLAGMGMLGFAMCALAEKIVPVLPSYMLLVVLGMISVSGSGDLVLTIVACTLGSTLGSVAWYLLGRSLGTDRGEAVIARFGRYVFFNVPQYRRLMSAYRRNRFWVTFAGQTIPAVRIYLAFPAGILRLPPLGFCVATFLGALAWNAPLLTLGYVLSGSNVDPATAAIWTIVGLLGLETCIALLMRVGRAHRRRTTNAVPVSQP